MCWHLLPKRGWKWCRAGVCMGVRVKIRRYGIHSWFGLLISPAHSVSCFSLCFLCCLFCLFVCLCHLSSLSLCAQAHKIFISHVYSLFSVLIFLPSSFVNELHWLQMFPVWQHLRPRLSSWAVSLGEACKQGCPGSASLFVLLCSLEVTGRRRGEAEPLLRLRRSFGCWFPLPLLTKGQVSVTSSSQLGLSQPLHRQWHRRRNFLASSPEGHQWKLGEKGFGCLALVSPSNGKRTATFDKRFAPLV